MTAAGATTAARGGAEPARLGGLDSIRFICALIVVFAHTGQPPIRQGLDASTPFGRIADGLAANIWSSAAAVIVFFVISGFCIHYPCAGRSEIRNVPEYYARRYVRILVPAGVAIALSVPVGLKLSLFQDTILWSVAAELIYYTLYPGLLAARRRLRSWLPLIGISFVLAFAVAATKPTIGEYPKFGLGLNWLLGLPCWLLGCWVADVYARAQHPRAARFVWPMRGAVWGAMILCSVLRYHSPLGYPWTLNLFAGVVALWLICELEAGRSRKAPPWLDWAGRWSYSLYLVHKIAAIVLGWALLPDLGAPANWALRLLAILAFAYAFYLVCESPSHHLAKWAGRQLRGFRPDAKPAGPGDSPSASALGKPERPLA